MSWHSIRLSALAVAAALLSPLWSSGSSRADGRPSIVTDPDAVVLGRTLTEWTALYLRWANATPASSLPPGCGPGTTVGPCYNAFYDPTGAYAEVSRARQPWPGELRTPRPPGRHRAVPIRHRRILGDHRGSDARQARHRRVILLHK